MLVEGVQMNGRGKSVGLDGYLRAPLGMWQRVRSEKPQTVFIEIHLHNEIA